MGKLPRLNKKKIVASPTEKAIRNENSEKNTVEAKDDITSTLNIGFLLFSLSVSSKMNLNLWLMLLLTLLIFAAEPKPLANAASDITNIKPRVNVLTVGSMMVKVNGLAESSGFLTVGTIPLDPRALQLDKVLNTTDRDLHN